MAWAPDYASTEELAAYMRIEDEVDNDQLSLAVAASSREIDRYCRRQFGQAESLETRYYTAVLDPETGRMVADIDDLSTTTGMTVEVDTGDETYSDTVGSCTMWPRNAAADGRPWTRLVAGRRSVGFPTAPDAVRVTARFGWAEVPPQVKQACLLQASRLMLRREAPFGVAGSPEAGSEVRLLAKLDPDVEVALAGLRRYRRGFA